jgi:uncharacterized damage-inducible protein DinB
LVDVAAIRTLYAYDTWVTEQLLDVASSLPAEVLRNRNGASFDSIQDNFAHVLGAQQAWLARWRGSRPDHLPGSRDFADLAEIRVTWTIHQTSLRSFLAELTPEQLVTKITYVNFQGEQYTYRLWQMMVHVVNHGTHHRAEIAELLTRAGHPPHGTDFLRYYDAIGENR